MKLENKPFTKALVTGATSGIGEALSRLLAEKKIPLILTGRNAEALQRLKEELSRQVPVITVRGDLSLKEDRAELIKVIHSNAPDLLINNAGYGLYGDALSFLIDDQMNVLEVDAVAVLNLTLAAAETLVKAKKEGVILNISSAAAFQVFPGFAVYAASKAFVNSLSESLDFELIGKGVRVLAACPGFIATGFSKRASGNKDAKSKRRIGTMSVSFAAEEIWRQIEKRKRLNIFDWRYRLATWLSFLVPKRISAWIVYRDVLSRTKN